MTSKFSQNDLSMNTIEDAKARRTRQLHSANFWLERLAYFIGSHADAVDGDDRVQLREVAHTVMQPHEMIASILASGPDGVIQFSFVQLAQVLEVVATAGTSTLQILGGRLARNETWGEPVEEDEGEPGTFGPRRT